MQTPKRKGGKYTHTITDHHITEEKYNKFTEEELKLKKFVRPKLIEEVKRLAQDGDFSENAAYQIAKGRLRGLNSRLDKLKEMIVKAVIIKGGNKDTVSLGSTIRIRQNDREKTYTILGSEEVNLEKGIISHNSPIGKALLGKREGDSFVYKTNDKTVSGKLLEIK